MYPWNLFFVIVVITLTLIGCATSVSTAKPVHAPTHFDCSSVQSLSPDLPEAKQIVDEFISNYKQDFPTEYMAIEQPWAVDQLGEYAVLQGRVTQEESDLIVVQRTQRGYMMVAQYHTHMDLAALGYSSIPEYFAAELPMAPPELFNCLDLNRFSGEETIRGKAISTDTHCAVWMVQEQQKADIARSHFAESITTIS